MKIIYTSALISHKREQRKEEYISSYAKLKSLIDEKDIFILECYSKDLDFFSNFNCQKFLSLTHDNSTRNKGVLEFKAIKKFIDNNSFLFSDDDFIVKLTGRYQLKTSKFFNVVQNNENFDVIAKLMNGNTQVFAGLFAMKYKYLKLFLNTTDFNFLENNMICIENSILDFSLQNNLSCGFINELEIVAPIFGTGDIMTLEL
jgi:hypothetical protein